MICVTSSSYFSVTELKLDTQRRFLMPLGFLKSDTQATDVSLLANAITSWEKSTMNPGIGWVGTDPPNGAFVSQGLKDAFVDCI